MSSCCLIFFFQAEDGIRDRTVTGVQTCALPIYPETAAAVRAILEDVRARGDEAVREQARRLDQVDLEAGAWERSEERRVGGVAGMGSQLADTVAVAHKSGKSVITNDLSRSSHYV